MADTKNSLSQLLTGAARNTWLALSEDETRIVGKGDTVENAVEAARKQGVDDPIIIWAPKQWTPTVFCRG
jgi:hypothetical protein